jgi:2-keto-4-pentenoate hydratase/2-oxohepta-3-ene-1,7-dioic acid hydratase in catechol pathway
MKLVTFAEPGFAARLGVLVDGDSRILDVQASEERRRGSPDTAYQSMQHLIEAGDEALAGIRAMVADHDDVDCVPLRGEGQLLAPLPCPIQMRDCLCFEAHLTNAIDGRNKTLGIAERTPEQLARFATFRSRPFWYKCNRFAVVGTDVTVEWPSYSSWMDFELELGLVIGRRGRGIRAEHAHQHIFGFTIFNDFSARDTQIDEMSMLGPSRSKDFDGANVLGPCIVTADAFNLADAKMEARVNGERWGGGSTASMTYSFAEVIAFISAAETLHPGELLGSGTVGTGCGMELGRRLASGDVVELEIEGIGILRNRVVAG